MITCALASRHLGSQPTSRSLTLVNTGLHQPGCLSAESTQHGVMQRFKQNTVISTCEQLAITQSLQSCHVVNNAGGRTCLFTACYLSRHSIFNNRVMNSTKTPLTSLSSLQISNTQPASLFIALSQAPSSSVRLFPCI